VEDEFYDLEDYRDVVEFKAKAYALRAPRAYSLYFFNFSS